MFSDRLSGKITANVAAFERRPRGWPDISGSQPGLARAIPCEIHLGIPSGKNGYFESELGIESAMVDQHDIQAQIDRKRALTPALAEQVSGHSPPEWLIE
jgi:hypothetical protein